MSRPLVLLDVDDVLADFVGAALGVIERTFIRYYKREQVTKFDFSSLPDWDEIRNRFWQCTKEPGFCESIEPIEGAVAGVNLLRQIANVEFLTSPMCGSPTWVHERDEWLLRHFGAHHHDIMHVRKKERVPGAVLVDDNTENVAKWCAAHPSGVGVLWAAPYNAGTVRNWETVYRIVERCAP